MLLILCAPPSCFSCINTILKCERPCSLSLCILCFQASANFSMPLILSLGFYFFLPYTVLFLSSFASFVSCQSSLFNANCPCCLGCSSPFSLVAQHCTAPCFLSCVLLHPAVLTCVGAGCLQQSPQQKLAVLRFDKFSNRTSQYVASVPISCISYF